MKDTSSKSQKFHLAKYKMKFCMDIFDYDSFYYPKIYFFINKLFNRFFTIISKTVKIIKSCQVHQATLMPH